MRKAMKIIENTIVTANIVLLIWVLVSWINVLMHHYTDEQYAFWNLITMIFS